MKHNFIIIMLIIGILSSCEMPLPDFKIDQSAESRLLIYAFPSDADDYIVNVSMTKSIYNELHPLEGLHVACTTNGKADEVTLLNIETHRKLPIAVFRVHGKHNTGDEIRIKVGCVGVPSAEACTTIPKSTEVNVNSVTSMAINNQHYRVFDIGFQDHPSTDYYAVRVMSYVPYPDRDDDDGWHPEVNDRENTEIYYDGTYSYYGKGHYDFYRISPEHEPLLKQYVDMNLDTWDENYRYMYIFNDEKMAKPDVTMHLFAESCYGTCTLQFYNLSKEYYEMLDRLNSQMNNELGASGFSQMYATYNNVKGGYGCVAAYTMRTCEYVVGGSGDEKYY